MAILDPAAKYIAAQREGLTDFIFRMTGDRSRAGIIASEVCEHVHRELMSSWSQRDILVELYSYAYELNADALRGIDRSFLESYFRNEIKDAGMVGQYYPIEILLQDLGLARSLTALLQHRFHFTDEESARILDKTKEEVDDDLEELAAFAKRHPKIKLELMTELPSYNFLSIPDYHPTALSHILVSMKSKRFSWGVRAILTLALLGLVAGWVIYLLRE